jgi:hypothetical protein
MSTFNPGSPTGAHETSFRRSSAGGTDYGKNVCGFAFRVTRPGVMNQWEARWDGSCGGFNFNSVGWTVTNL